MSPGRRSQLSLIIYVSEIPQAHMALHPGEDGAETEPQIPMYFMGLGRLCYIAVPRY